MALAGEPIPPVQTTRTGLAKLNVTVSPSLSCVDRSALVERLQVMLASLRGPELGPLQVAISGSPLALKVAVSGPHVASETTLTSPHCETAIEAIAAFVGSVTLPEPTTRAPTLKMPSAPETPSDIASESNTRERATLLAVYLPEAIGRERPRAARILGGVTAGVGAATIALAIGDSSNPGKQRAIIGVSGGLWLGGGLASLFVPDTHTYDTALATFYAGLGTLWISMWTGDSRAHAPYVAAFAAGAYMTSALAAINVASDWRTPREQLVADYAQVCCAEQRSRISATEVSRIERDFYQSRRTIPLFWIYLPQLAGGLTSSAIAVFDRNTDGRNGRIILPFVYSMAGLPALFVSEPFHRYEDALGRLRLKVRLGPGPTQSAGLSVLGIFQ